MPVRRRPTENKDAEPVIQQDDALIAQKDAEIAEMMAKVQPHGEVAKRREVADLSTMSKAKAHLR